MTPSEFHQGDMSPSGLARFRAQSAEHPYVHIRKRCACNAIVTARQLEQYGRCATCEKVARIVALHVARESA